MMKPLTAKLSYVLAHSFKCFTSSDNVKLIDNKGVLRGFLVYCFV